MKTKMEKLGEAYLRYALNPSKSNLCTLEKLTGAKTLLDVLEATEEIIDQSTDIKPLRGVQQAVRQLDAEPEIMLLDQRIQAKSSAKMNSIAVQAIGNHLRHLRQTLRRRIRHLTQSDTLKAKVQMQLFTMCCRHYQQMIESGTTDILGPQSYRVSKDSQFRKDAKLINQISKLSHPRKKLQFFCEHIHRLQDKYLEGEVIEDQLCQLIIIVLSCADNPQLLWDLKIADRAVTPRLRYREEGHLMDAASGAIYLIQKEALPMVKRDLSQIPRLSDLEEDLLGEAAA